MASEPDKDDIADALARMADGLPDKPPRPAQPPNAAQPPRSASEFRPPSPPRPAASAPAPTPDAKPKPARPERPRPDRPAAPPSQTPADEQADAVNIIDDGDAVIVPAPDAQVFAPKPASARPARPSITRSLGFRRTIIPILLTCGVLLLGIGLLKWIAGADSLFSDMALSLSAVLCVSGAFLLLVAVLNMLQVKAELQQARRSGAP